MAAEHPVWVGGEDSNHPPLWETWLAITPNHNVMSVFHNMYKPATGPGDPNAPEAVVEKTAIGYALYSFKSSPPQWVGNGVIPHGDYGAFGGDPCVAADPIRKTFFATARGGSVAAGGITHILYAKYNALLGSWMPWQVLAYTGGSGASALTNDKPWLVAGEMTGTLTTGVAEYYSTFHDGTLNSGNYAYVRYVEKFGAQGSTFTTVFDDIEVGGNAISGVRPSHQCTVAGAGPLYEAYAPDFGSGTTPMKFRFLVGTDVNGSNGENEGVSFDYLYASAGVPLELALRHYGAGSQDDEFIPGGLQIATVPWILADPTDVDRLFLVYHTTKVQSWTTDAGHADFDIYARVLTRSGGYWSAGEESRVNDDDTEFESDQFLPSATVDASGRMHSIWYDDRLYNTTSDQADNTQYPKFDVYYARCIPSGSGFDISVNELLYGTGVEEGQPALDYPLLEGWAFPNRPGEYNGIGVEGDVVWTTYTGTTHASGSGVANPSVIWSSVIDWTP